MPPSALSPPPTNGGFQSIQVRYNDELEHEALQEYEAQRQSPVMTELAGYVRRLFMAAHLHRQDTGITDHLLDDQRQRKGEYDSDKLGKIKEYGMSELFFNETATKCEAGEAWMLDTLSQLGSKRTWALEPTPVPELSEALRAQVVERTQEAVMGMLDEGFDPTPTEISEMALNFYDETEAAVKEEAQERCDRMAEKILDQLVEGGYTRAFRDFVHYFFTYKLAILKGPVLVKKKRLAWENGQVIVKDEIVMTWEAPSPHDFYPGPNTRDLGTSYVCEVIRMDRAHLSRMRGVDGWNTVEIEAALAEAPTQLDPELEGQTERAELEERESPTAANEDDATFQGVEFWGPIQGGMLMEWGMKGITDPNQFYEVCAILFGHHVVKAILNPDPLDRRPYFATSFYKLPGSLYGLSTPEKMRDVQTCVNATLRALINNLAIGSGPMVAGDIKAMPAGFDPTKMFPFKFWPYDGSKARKTTGQGPYTFFQPNIQADMLLRVAEYFSRKADDRTLIPRFAHGNEEMGGAGQTASGMSMLMNSAFRGIKQAILNVDLDIQHPAVERMFIWNMLHLPDEEYGSLKGDAKVMPRGITAMLMREQQQIRLQEFLNLTNNETDMLIIGVEGRATVLREVARLYDLPEDEIIPDKETLRARVISMQQQAEEEAQADESGKSSASEAA